MDSALSLLLNEPDDLIREKCKLMDPKTLSRFMRTSKRINNICKDIMAKRKLEHEEKKLIELSHNPYFGILLEVDHNTVMEVCRTYIQAASICKSPLFWRQKALLNFNTPFEEFVNTKLSPPQRYLQLYNERA